MGTALELPASFPLVGREPFNTTPEVTPRAARSTPNEFAVSNWRAFEKNTPRGFLSLTTPSGLVSHACTFHQKEGSRWVGMPAQRFAKNDGPTSYAPVVEFWSKDARERFQAAAVRAVERFLSGNGGGDQW